MTTQIRTVDFLPEIFRTETNRQFLDATLDVLTQQPEVARVQGYIGQRWGLGVDPRDRYVVEPTKTRRDYQLNPSVVFCETDTQTAQDFINYPGIIQALKNLGAQTDNPDRLFSQDFSSWDPFISLDAAVNYAQYYWIPLGPSAVPVTALPVYLAQNYSVDTGGQTLDIQGFSQNNPALTLLRGGTYTFTVQGGNALWIQGLPGLSQAAQNSRGVLGVTDNGATAGTVTFTVPTSVDLLPYTIPGNLTVDLVSTQTPADIEGQVIDSIDGVTLSTGLSLLFYNNGQSSSQTNFYTVNRDNITGVITLSPGLAILNFTAITALSGTEFLGRRFYRNGLGLIEELPVISNTLYLQSGTQPGAVAVVNLIDNISENVIRVDQDILGRASYTSPLGIRFTNGLKVRFDSSVLPQSYAEGEYYVEGVGTAITLLPVSEYQSVESISGGLYELYDTGSWDSGVWDVELFVPVEPQYITVSRNSRDRNAWTRANRWFHQDVLDETQRVLGYITDRPNNTVTRAQRPVLLFEGNLQLFQSGTLDLGFVNFVDTEQTDALTNVTGSTSYLVDGQQLQQGDLVVFVNDVNPITRATVWRVNRVPVSDGTSIINLVSADSAVQGSQFYVGYGRQWAGTSWFYTQSTALWTQSQRYQSRNQAPLFDIFDTQGISLGDPRYYPGTDFAGCKLFSYTPGSGPSDPVLGFPISYSSVNNIGDIEFTVNLNSDSFTYSGTDLAPVSQAVNTGYVYQHNTTHSVTRRIGWVPAIQPSVQSQVFEFTVQTQTQTVFVLDVPAQAQGRGWATVQVYVNGQILDDTEFSWTVTGTETTVSLNTAAVRDSSVTVLAISDTQSGTAYYEIPANLENNPFNTPVQNLAVGDLRNQYSRIYANAPDLVGPVFGDNNFHDLGDLNSYGDAIILNSSSLVLPGAFLRDTDYSVTDSIEYNKQEYLRYRQLLVDTTAAGDWSIYQTPAQILDQVVLQITDPRNTDSSFFWTDMFPSGSPYRTNTYRVGTAVTEAVYPLSRVYDFSSANYWGLSVYVNRRVDGILTSIQMMRTQVGGPQLDYTVNPQSPRLQLHYDLQAGDTVTVNEYNQTWGTFCPSTPTKLGLYQRFLPGVILDSTYTTPTYWIQGHDGSLTRLYGSYEQGRLTDFRDQVLLEFEQRVYNDIKVTGTLPLQYTDVWPGQWRDTGYSLSTVLDLYSTQFLSWVSQNNIDYRTQVYNQGNEYTYNYNQASNRLNTGDRTALNQGYWRGVYRWFYDTDHPDTEPWALLGYTEQPQWWTAEYGAPPYTSGNTRMWTDISLGRRREPGNLHVDQRYARPELLSVLPVDGAGNLLPPFQTVVGAYDALSWQRDWRVGDQAPAENSYLRSSTWPYDLMRLLLLTRPAQFYNLFVDRDLYRYDTEFRQYLYQRRAPLNPRTVEVYGAGKAKHSYINWVVDYIRYQGRDGTAAVQTLLQNLDVRLTYSVAGFTSRDQLRFLVERAGPDSRNTGLVIPDDSYRILLYNNVPSEQIEFSNVIVQRDREGWRVRGSSQRRPLFTTAVPVLAGPYQNITEAGVTVRLSSQAYPGRTQTVPYNTVLYSPQSVCEFLLNYGRHLELQGVQPGASDGYTWLDMCREFLSWSQQNWAVGSITVFNPQARVFTVDRPGLVVQPLSLHDQNYILNQNLLPLQPQSASVTRENTRFSVRVLSPGDTVSYTNLNLAAIEHAVVFDNTTVFNDTVYNLGTGLRQQRLLMQGSKSARWQGYMSAPGYIINPGTVPQWVPNQQYPQGSIVQYKNLYWVADTLITPQSLFRREQWRETQYQADRAELLPNPSTTAWLAQYYYDPQAANLELDVDLLSYSLIGFRPRQYMTDAGLSDTTQIGVYKQMIGNKGTNSIANAFKNREFAQGRIDYDLQEQWALQVGVFGSVLNSNFVEFPLNAGLLQGNPATLQFSTSSRGPGSLEQTVYLDQFTNYQSLPTEPDFLPPRVYNPPGNNPLPGAGYVNTAHASITAYRFADLNADPENLNRLITGNSIWIADLAGTWAVLQPVSLGTHVIAAVVSQTQTATFVFAGPHGLQAQDLFAVVDFAESYNGFYRVRSVPSLQEVTVEYVPGPATVPQIQGLGYAFRLQNRRVQYPSNIAQIQLGNRAFQLNRAWVDNLPGTDSWAVYANGPTYTSLPLPLYNQPDLGVNVSFSLQTGFYAGSPAQNTVFRYQGNRVTQRITPTVTQVDYGWAVEARGSELYILSAYSIWVYRLNTGTQQMDLIQVIERPNTGQLAVSGDARWMYVCNQTENRIYVYYRESTVWALIPEATVLAPQGNIQWGQTVRTCRDGSVLVVGAPAQTNNNVAEQGAVYVYQRYTQAWIYQADPLFQLQASAPSNAGIVTVNGVQTLDYTLTGETLSVSQTVLTQGSTVAVRTGRLTLAQVLRVSGTGVGGRLGQSCDTNQLGANIVAGSPYEVNNQAEGSVYLWTNGAQQWGQAVLRQPRTVNGQWLLINDYRVVFPQTTDPSVIALAINTQIPQGVRATVDSDNLSVSLTVSDSVQSVPGRQIHIQGDIQTLQSLGITLYQYTQRVLPPVGYGGGQFGAVVVMDEAQGLVVTAPTASARSRTAWDVEPQYILNETVFDSGATSFIDQFTNSGSGYLYQLLQGDGTAQVPHAYVFSQYLMTPDTYNISLNPGFGLSACFSQGNILIGAPDWFSDGSGRVQQFYRTAIPGYTTLSGQTDTVPPSGWFIDARPVPAVNIWGMRSQQIYSASDNSTLAYLDTHDPLQGKLLGAVRQDLDYICPSDPAGYGPDAVSWGQRQVGRLWLDTSTVRILDYHQPDLDYNAANWGRAFPGSTAQVYTWVESTVGPSDYTGPGSAISSQRSVSAIVVDSASNSLVTVYYFWVSGLNSVSPGKNLSPRTISQYILNPQTSGISYLAPLTLNSLALYNSADSIQAQAARLHVGYGAGGSPDQEHQQWQLIAVGGDSTDFLPGLPTLTQPQPQGLYLKFLDSFAGLDSLGNAVPDPNLPPQLQTGTLFRPRQSFYTDRAVALENYLDYVNTVLRAVPVTETRNLSLLNTASTVSDTRDYWVRVNWWAPGYSDSTKIQIEVQTYTDLLEIEQVDLAQGAGGLALLSPGTVARVLESQTGNPEVYVYSSTRGWTRVGVNQGTVQFSDTLWNGSTTGWDATSYDTGIFDYWPHSEIRSIIRWVNEELFTGELTYHRNRALELMFNVIQSTSLQQNNYLPWLNKTSLIRVNHKIRDLLPTAQFQSDNVDFVRGYIEEVKPFHVFISDFVYRYTVSDTARTAVVDYDLPARYDTATQSWQTPELVFSTPTAANQYTLDSPVWQLPEYVNWHSAWGLGISNATDRPQGTATLNGAVTATQTQIPVYSVTNLPIQGLLQLNEEIVGYTGLDYTSPAILNVVRGLAGTVAAAHADETVGIQLLPSVSVYDAGSGYLAPPRVRAEIDTATYPSPRVPAEFEAVLSGGSVYRIRVLNPGSGYAVQPRIVVEPSRVLDFSATDVNTVLRTVTVLNHGLASGTAVYFDGSPGPLGLEPESYYFVRALDANTLALYTNRYDSLLSTTPLASVDDVQYRVPLITQAPGTLSITVRAVPVSTGLPVRQFAITLKFDRTVYRLNTGWDVNPYDTDAWDAQDSNAARRIYDSYRPTLSMPGLDLPQLMEGVQYPRNTYTGATFEATQGWDNVPWDSIGWNSAIPNLGILDTELISPQGSSTAPTVYDVQGGQFTDGHGPEELVPGLVTDRVDMTVTTVGSIPTFRISVDSASQGTVWRANPMTQTTLSAEFVSNNRIDDEIQLVDASVLVRTPGQSRGVFFVAGEYIGWTSIDLATNTVTGLQRGLFGTIVNSVLPLGTRIYARVDQDELDDSYYNTWWYGAPSSPGAATTLATNTSPAAVFLQDNTP